MALLPLNYSSGPTGLNCSLLRPAAFKLQPSVVFLRRRSGRCVGRLPTAGRVCSVAVQTTKRIIHAIWSSIGKPERIGGSFTMASLSTSQEWVAESSSLALSSSEKCKGGKYQPEHLVLLVHGIFASANDWKYVAGELVTRLGPTVLVHASASNSYFLTLEGIDIAGMRLAEEVHTVRRKYPSLKRISVVAHSLGGLIARFAVAKLFVPVSQCSESDGPLSREGKSLGLLAGLEPVNFITLATPHLGVRGRSQLPFLLGLGVLENLAPPLAPLFVGQTGRQLFLSDGNPAKGKRPLLLRMTADGKDGPFISALSAFRMRVLYANTGYDHMVGWRTSSILRESELPKLPKNSLSSRYKHVLFVQDSPGVEHFSPANAKFVNSTSDANGSRTANESAAKSHDVIEEEIISRLQQVPWRRVGVSFREAHWPFFAHNNIHVKLHWIHYEGAGVVAHLADTIYQTDSVPQPIARL